LNHPHRVGIAGFDGAVDGVAVVGEEFGYRLARLGQIHFVEAVGEIVGALAEFFFPFLNEHLADLVEQRRTGCEQVATFVGGKTAPAQFVQCDFRVQPLQSLRHKSRKCRYDWHDASDRIRSRILCCIAT